MEKKNYYTFFPKDWIDSPIVMGFNPVERYIWFEMISVMHMNKGVFNYDLTSFKKYLRCSLKRRDWDSVFKVLEPIGDGKYTHHTVMERLKKSEIGLQSSKRRQTPYGSPSGYPSGSPNGTPIAKGKVKIKEREISQHPPSGGAGSNSEQRGGAARPQKREWRPCPPGQMRDYWDAKYNYGLTPPPEKETELPDWVKNAAPPQEATKPAKRRGA